MTPYFLFSIAATIWFLEWALNERVFILCHEADVTFLHRQVPAHDNGSACAQCSLYGKAAEKVR